MTTGRILCAVLLTLVAGSASAAPQRKNFATEQKFNLAPDGVFVLENPIGDITVHGSNVSSVEATVVRTISGETPEQIEEGRRNTGVIIGGDDRTRIVRAGIPANPRGWSASMAWNIKLPSKASIRIISRQSRQIIVAGVAGAVHVRNFNGNVQIESSSGPVRVESVNGSVLYRIARPRHNVVLTSVNGSVTAAVASNADLRWVAETAKGDLRTNLPARGAFFGTTFRGSVNAPGGPTITTATLMGDVQLISTGRSVRGIQSLRTALPTPAPASQRTPGAAAAGVPPTFSGFFRYETNLGDVRLQEIRGDADIFTGAGEVQLGSVSGNCKVRSKGGPLQLGEILGNLWASTRAGDVLVDSARRGGTIRTEGGTIRLLYTSGPTTLRSGGGDVIVRQAAAPIDAQTTSGDITLNVDPASRTQKLDAQTGEGNVTINVTPQFAADVDALIITSSPDVDTIVSDLPGLTITKEEIAGKTHVRAVGKLNGGGERLLLRAVAGDIRISTRPIAPTVITSR